MHAEAATDQNVVYPLQPTHEVCLMNQILPQIENWPVEEVIEGRGS